MFSETRWSAVPFLHKVAEQSDPETCSSGACLNLYKGNDTCCARCLFRTPTWYETENDRTTSKFSQRVPKLPRDRVTYTKKPRKMKKILEGTPRDFGAFRGARKNALVAATRKKSSNNIEFAEIHELSGGSREWARSKGAMSYWSRERLDSQNRCSRIKTWIRLE